MIMTTTLVPALVFPALVLIAAARDATSFTIPNWISVTALIAFFPAALAVGAPPALVLSALGVGAVFLAVGVVMFAFGWIGGGDAKLLAACALWMGWPAAMTFLFWTSAAGGALALVLLGARNLTRQLPIGGPLWFHRLMTEKSDIPYGVAIAAGALAAFPASLLMKHPF